MPSTPLDPSPSRSSTSSTPHTPLSEKKSKTEEFARLFSLFDTLVERRSRVVLKNDSRHVKLSSSKDYPPSDSRDEKSSKSIEDEATTLELMNTLTVPAELHGILRNLSSLVDSRVSEESEQEIDPSPGRRQRSQTVSSSTPSSTLPTSSISSPLNTQGGYYPFTFKMMLHKLYEMEEWGDKVQEMLEKSRNAFKSLAEPDEAGKAALTHNASSPVCPSIFIEEAHDPQPVKKRCIGRRMSLAALPGTTSVPEAVFESTPVRLDQAKSSKAKNTLVVPFAHPKSPRLAGSTKNPRSPVLGKRRPRYSSLGFGSQPKTSISTGPIAPTSSASTKHTLTPLSPYAPRRVSLGTTIPLPKHRRVPSSSGTGWRPSATSTIPPPPPAMYIAAGKTPTAVSLASVRTRSNTLDSAPNGIPLKRARPDL